MQTAFHIGGFWFYVTWAPDGSTGKDQNGKEWIDKDRPHTSTGAIESACTATHAGLMAVASRIK